MSCSIGLCVYNNAFGLPYIFKNIEKIQTLFTEKINIIIFYDESQDESLQIIHNQIETNKNQNIKIIHNTKPKTNLHVDNICYARNSILEYIRSNIPNTKYLMMMDSNEYACVGEIQLQPLRDVFLREAEWDAVSFDREAGYYDHWALSFDPFVYSFFHTANFEKTVEKLREKFGEILTNARKTPSQFVPVYSAFNGFAIYKWSIFQNCKYDTNIDVSLFPVNILQKQINYTGVPLIQYFKGDCEHRYFHLQAIARENARIMIYPQYIFAKFKRTPMPGCRGPC
jgi:glycosyltransferase involved in cell wall biosynthesis